MIRKIEKAAVIGAGVMGGGIAALLASAGIPTLLIDIVPPDLKPEEKDDPKARNRFASGGLERVIKSKPSLLMSKKDAQLISIGNLEDDFDKLGECDWIVEVVVENPKIKRDLFKRIDPIRKENAVVSTNTSGIPLKTLSEGMSADFCKHFLGTHFFNPVRYMKLLEIIPGADTDPEILDFMSAFGEKMLGKGIVKAKDTPNFVGNRIGVHGMVKAMQLMAEHGLTPPEVDAIFGKPMGRPKTAMFGTADLVGMDVLYHVAKNTYDLVPDDEQRDSFKVPDFVNVMVKNNLLGKKVGAGFYKSEKTDKGKRIKKVLNFETKEYETFEKPKFPCVKAAKKAKTPSDRLKAIVYGEDKGAKFSWDLTAVTLIYAANRIPEIADTIIEIDNSMKWGYNFEMGPFETWDAIGVKESVGKMEAEGLPVPEKVKKMLADGNTSFYKIEGGQPMYYDFASGDYKVIETDPTVISLPVLKADGKTALTCKSASLIDLGDGVFCCEFHTKMNALNAEIVEFIDGAVDHVAKNGVGLVIGNQAGGMPPAFSAGADLFYMGSLAIQARFDEMDAFVKKGQYGLQKLHYAPFPVVAAPFGLTLGGGCEVCLGADMIVAHAELYMGLVEVGVGLLPGGGGCMNLWKRFLESVPEAVAKPDLPSLFLPVFKNIAMAQVSTSAAEARALGFLRPTDRIVFNRDHLIGEAKREVLNLVNRGYTPPVKKKIKVAGREAQGMVNAELFNMSSGGFVSEYDAFLAKKIAYTISGGDVLGGMEIDEDVILTLERKTFIELWQQGKTHDRIQHMLKTGKPLRN